jgi:hypothetical protein
MLEINDSYDTYMKWNWRIKSSKNRRINSSKNRRN